MVSVMYLSACGNQSTESHEHDHEQNVEGHDHHVDGDAHHQLAYSCPMKCEGDKVYDKEGSCPDCGMDLEEVEIHAEHGTEVENTDQELKSDEGGEEHTHDHDGDHNHDH